MLQKRNAILSNEFILTKIYLKNLVKNLFFDDPYM